VIKAVAKPTSAPIIIIPSIPRLRIPERSVNISPMMGKSNIVPDSTVAAKRIMIIE
jgi:hypothetical protein